MYFENSFNGGVLFVFPSCMCQLSAREPTRWRKGAPCHIFQPE